MTHEAIDIYDDQLSEIMGEKGFFSEKAFLDPSGENKEIWGLYDENVMADNKDSANVYQKNSKARFSVSTFESFDVYQDKEIYLTKREKTFKIKFAPHDVQGNQILWLQSV